MPALFKHCLLTIAHWVGMRTIAVGMVQACATTVGCSLVMALAGLMTGCASLPDSVPRSVSQARIDVADTHLAAVAAASTPEGSRELSGMRLLPAGDHAFEARIALVRAAERSIDAQYYQIADDASGRQFLRELRDAGTRGVRVRLLVDDLHAAGEDDLLAGLARQPGVEVRMFNPLPVRSGGVGSRVLFSLHEFSRINRRMHNKLLVADNVFAISGGRNIADEYFGRGGPANFIDMDMLSSGPVVRQLSAVFDGYWNSEHAYPIESLATQEGGGDAVRRRFDAHVQQQPGPAEAPVATLDPLGQSSVGMQLAGGRVGLHMAAVRLIADAPAKADAGNTRFAEGAVMSDNLDLLQSARTEVLVASPYFVPGRRALEIFKQSAASQVQISVMTNSLATTDEPLVHFGYARQRGALLRMGVALYELMPGAHEPDTTALEQHGSLGRLHAKLAVVDRRWLSIGSMNMDRRSAHCNTEMGMIVDSPELASQVAFLLERERLTRSYQVRITADSDGLNWVARSGPREVTLAAEPNLSWTLQLRMSLLGLIVSDELL